MAWWCRYVHERVTAVRERVTAMRERVTAGLGSEQRQADGAGATDPGDNDDEERPCLHRRSECVLVAQAAAASGAKLPHYHEHRTNVLGKTDPCDSAAINQMTAQGTPVPTYSDGWGTIGISR